MAAKKPYARWWSMGKAADGSWVSLLDDGFVVRVVRLRKRWRASLYRRKSPDFALTAVGADMDEALRALQLQILNTAVNAAVMDSARAIMAKVASQEAQAFRLARRP
jgi:hypothetical protein